MSDLRALIREEIVGIEPLDAREQRTIEEVVAWIDSGEPLCRIEKPATPPMHLVSYFVLVDGEYVMLVDHLKALLWLPTGGHVEPDEHPRTTVRREAREELGIEAEFLFEEPLLVTSTVTVGKTAGHTDVSLWYVLRARRHDPIDHDETEFREARWFHRDAIPYPRTDPQMKRFMQKLSSNRIET